MEDHPTPLASLATLPLQGGIIYLTTERSRVTFVRIGAGHVESRHSEPRLYG